VTARSISADSLTSTGVNSTPNDGATLWAAPNCPIPGDGRISKDRHPRDAGRDLFEQLQPFSAHAVFVKREPSRVAAVVPAQLLQGLCEGGEPGLSFYIVRGQIREHADAPHALPMLRVRGERPRDCGTAEHTKKFASPHVPSKLHERASYCRRLSLRKGDAGPKPEELELSKCIPLDIRQCYQMPRTHPASHS
jgi:hypothetical protein